MNKLVEKFGKQKRWVNWRKEERDGKTTKVPLGKSDDPSTWSVLADLPDQENIGIMFGLKKKLLGIDIDKCLILGEEIDPVIWDLIKVADTYTEISPSGTGLHLFLELEESMDLKANRKGGYECYTTGRYFTVTQKPFNGYDVPVRKVSVAEAEEILETIGYPWKKEETNHSEKPNSSETIEMSDDELLIKMFKSKGGDKIRATWEGDISTYNNDHSIADMGLLSHLAFWTQGNKQQMERLWLASPLGARGKTQERQDYRTRSIDNAIGNCKEFYKPRQKRTVETRMKDEEGQTITIPVTDSQLLEELGLYYTISDKGKSYSLIQENINIILEKHPAFAGRFRYDEFLIAEQIKIDGTWEVQKDIHEILIQSEISTIVPVFNRVSPKMVERAIRKVAHDNRIDSAKEYVKSLKWDGVARIDTWLQEVFGCEDDEYTRQVGSNWFKGLTDRMINPGCQFDYILVVEGAQGMRKSSAFRELVTADWHLETERSPGEKDFFVEMAGKAIVELSEGQSNATVDVKKMKSIITKRKDTYRAPYDKKAADHPRRSVFCMTTNDEEYLKDTTGDRRWWPVTCTKKADLQWIRNNRDEMFAEAYHRLTEGKETTYEIPEEEAMARQEDRRQKDANTDSIVKWYKTKATYYNRKEGVSTLDVYIGAFFDGEQPQNIAISRLHQISIASVLTTTLKLKRRRTMIDGIRTYRFYDPALDDGQEVFDLPIEKPEPQKSPEGIVLATSLDDF